MREKESCTPHRAGERATCPACKQVGRPVGDATVRAMLDPEKARSLLSVPLRFCRTSSCDVLYYGTDGRNARKQDARVRVGLKETEDPIPLCYCFGFGRADVEREIARTGYCTIPERINAEIRAGRCECEIKNPSGGCCLGEVGAAVTAALRRIGSLRCARRLPAEQGVPEARSDERSEPGVDRPGSSVSTGDQ